MSDDDKTDGIKFLLRHAEFLGITEDELREYLNNKVPAPTDSGIPTLLDVKQVAEILQVHPMTVKAYINEGIIKATQTRRKYLIREEDLFAFLENQSVDVKDLPND